jgi:hypothetical protein
MASSRSGSPPAEPDLAGTRYEQYVWSPRYVDAPILRDRDTTAGGNLGRSGSGLDERVAISQVRVTGHRETWCSGAAFRDLRKSTCPFH